MCNRHNDNRNRNDVFGIQTFVDQDDFCRAVRRCNRRNNDDVGGVSDRNRDHDHHHNCCCRRRRCCGFFW